MTKYLLAAEADKIQDLLFNSSHLREVVGASQRLSAFCERMPVALELKPDRVVTSDGGSFTLEFDSTQEAEKFGKKLAEAYRQYMHGSFTVAEPVKVNGDFASASEKAQKLLRRAKSNRPGCGQTPHHMPYMALCVSCGSSPATRHRSLPDVPDSPAQYYCESCLKKSETRNEQGVSGFIKPFYQLLSREGLVDEKKGKVTVQIPTSEDVSRLDPKNYVAYLLADGNDMGEVFGKCDKPRMKVLSGKLTKITRESLAKAANDLLGEQAGKIEKKLPRKIPVLPLILGGDDLFALIPARWSLDFARRFVREYEKRMAEFFRESEIDAPPATICAAVVICKAKYPYYFAHQRGEALLEKAKQLTKSHAFETRDPARSTIHFDVILGNRLATEEAESKYRPTLRPYFADGENIDGWGIEIGHLIDQRYRLRKIPKKRLAELRALFDELSSQPPEREKQWLGRLEKLVKRITKVSDYDNTVAGALKALGGKDALFQVERAFDKSNWRGHAMPDLLDAWDFVHDMDRPAEDYQGGSR